MSVLIDALTQTSFYLVIAMGLSIIFGIMHIINFAHGSFYMIAAYMCFYLYQAAGLDYWLTLVLVALTLGIVGWVAQYTVFRRFLGRFGGGLLISIALGMIIDQIANIAWGGSDKSVAPVFAGGFSIAGTEVSYQKLVVLIASILIVAFVLIFIKYTKKGLSMRAVEQNQEAAKLQGINVQSTARMAMFVGTALAGIAGCLISPVFCVYPAMGSIALVRGLFIIIIGGMGTLWGIIIGAFVIGFTEVIFTALFNPSIGTIAIFVVALGIFTIKPTGILGHEYVRMQ